MGLGGRSWLGVDDTDPVVRTSKRPPKVWGTVTVEDDSLVVVLEGWRAVWAAKRRLQVPLSAVIAVEHDPGAYSHIKTRLRGARRTRNTTFKLGAQHSADGWSFWACGLARNAVVLETVGVRYRFVVVEVADPASLVLTVRKAAGIEAPKPAVPPTVRSITESKRLRRVQKPVPRSAPGTARTKGPTEVASIERPPRDPAPKASDAASRRPRIAELVAEPTTGKNAKARTDTTKEHDQT
jgi:hypothetical protein